MNTERRKLIQEARDKLAEAKALVEQAQQEEQDYFDNMPENLQDAVKGQTASDTADKLQEVVDSLEEAESGLEEAQA